MVLDVLDDDECFERLKTGDEHAYSRLIGIYGPVLCRYANKIMEDSAAAEDVVADTLVKVWEKRGTFASFDHIKRFLYIAVRNAALQYDRDRRREQQKFAAFNDALPGIAIDEVIYAELMVELQKVIYALPEKMREVFILGYVRQLSNQEIARKLNLSDQTVRNQKAKALSIIRNKFSNRPFPEIYILLIWLFR